MISSGVVNGTPVDAANFTLLTLFTYLIALVQYMSESLYPRYTMQCTI
jgi:hypothetical protein